MRITVEDCLKLDAFNGSQILSCHRKADRRVRSVSVLDEEDLEQGVDRNGVKEQMVITHFWSHNDDIEGQCKAVKGLGKRGVAALVVYLNENGIRQIDPQVVNAAEEGGLLLITLMDDGRVTYAMLISQVMDKILYGHNFSDNILNNTIYHLLNFEKHSSFPAALREAAIYNDYQVVLMTADYNQILTIETRHIVSIDDIIQLARQHESIHPNTYTKVSNDDVITYWGLINIEEQKYIMMIVDNEDNYSEVEMKKLSEIIELAIGMWKYTPERDSKAEFIKSAVRGDMSFCYTLLEEAGLKGKNFTSVFYAKDADDAEFLGIINRYKNKYNLGCLTLMDEHDMYGIIYTDETTELNGEIDVKHICLKMYEELKSGRKQVRIFHMTGMTTLDSAVEGFRLINRTWTGVETVFPFKRVFTKYEMSMVCDCINLNTSGNSIKKMYSDLLEPFEREISQNKGKLLLDTLSTFVLDAGMNSGKTAEFMNIHNNTVQYRLKRINEILGADMTGNRIIPGLTMALAIKRLEA